MMKKILLCLTLLAATADSDAQSGYKLVNTFSIASGGGWDYIAVHGNKLYVSHGNQVNILDKKTGDSLGVIPGTIGVHGIAFDDASGKGFTSNGRLNNVFVFDLKTNLVMDSIKTGENPDAIFYEDYSGKIITCNGRSKDLTVIDPVKNKVVATIQLTGKPETAVSDGAGKVFVNNEDKSEIVVVDIKNYKVMANWSIAPGEEPSGLSIDRSTKRLFAGCDNRMLVVVNATNGKIVSKQPIDDGCDGTAFNSKLQYVYSSNGEGSLTVIEELSRDNFKVLENLRTQKGARTLCVDPESGNVFLPTADFEPNTPEGQWPKMILGTFRVLVYAKK